MGLNLPEPTRVTGKILPFFVVVDDAFPMSVTFLKPIGQKQLTKKRGIFNYRLSRACRIIQNVFGILVARFGTFQIQVNANLERSKSIVLACIGLFFPILRVEQENCC